MGFTNQIMAFIYSIIKTIKSKNHRVVVIDHFLIDYLKMDYTSISKIINLKELNIYLLQKYNVIVIDKYNSKFGLVDVYYGVDNANKIEITDEIKSTFLSMDGSRLFINKYTDFNRIKGDPFFDKEKTVFLKYEITIETGFKYTIEEKYNEWLNEHIIIDISNAEYNLEFVNLYDIYRRVDESDIFEDILNKITYSSEFYQLAEKITKYIDVKQKVNVIHLRIEPDAITHWSKINKMEPKAFQKCIEDKYIELVKKYMNKSDAIIILSNSTVNGVIDFLIKHNYHIFITYKYFIHREKNALVDLLVSKRCNNIFVGCFTILKTGSTFSNYISKIMGKDVMKVGINIDFITLPEEVF
jgi:hypothetical protein